MIDFFVREARAVVEGDVAIIRFGSCGSLDPSFGCGSLGVPLAAMSVTTNYAATRGVDVEPYLFSPPVRRLRSTRLVCSHASSDCRRSISTRYCTTPLFVCSIRRR